LIASALLTMGQQVAAGVPSVLEGRALDVIKAIETHLTPKLPVALHLVAEHPSPLSQKLLPGPYVRDCWIARGEQVVARIVVYCPANAGSHGFEPAATASQSVKIVEEGEEVALRVGIVCDDPALTVQLLSLVNEIDLTTIEWTKW
jgi:hypothetical protein